MRRQIFLFNIAATSDFSSILVNVPTGSVSPTCIDPLSFTHWNSFSLLTKCPYNDCSRFYFERFEAETPGCSHHLLLFLLLRLIAVPRNLVTALYSAPTSLQKQKPIAERNTQSSLPSSVWLKAQ